jgi:O-antigen ligase/polysaccharide polymerase Wzy-like membrane protein
VTVYALCILTFVICFWAGRRQLWAGFVTTLAVGYFYGILRANIPQPASHFTFDTGALGLYLALLIRTYSPAQKYKVRKLLPWFLCLVAWPTLLFFVPIQNPLIQSAGLRGQIFFLPFLLIGAQLERDDANKIAVSIAVLNTIVLVFALLEVKLGISRFYPSNVAVDDIIYISAIRLRGGDLATRIPATFTSSAAYGGNMIASLPFLLGGLAQERRVPWRRNLLLAGTGVSAVGVFLAASRTVAVTLFALFLMFGCVTFWRRLRNMPWGGWLALLLGLAWLVYSVPRLQRFVELQDTAYVKTRIGYSVNSSFLQLMKDYPLGNGLGCCGTSMPYFLQGEVRNSVGMENEYARIMLEQGVPGLALWLAFIVWLLTRPVPRRSEPWYVGRWLARLLCAISFATAPMGLGMLTAIPQTASLLVLCGWIASPQVVPVRRRARQAEESPEQSTAALQGA